MRASLVCLITIVGAAANMDLDYAGYLFARKENHHLDEEAPQYLLAGEAEACKFDGCTVDTFLYVLTAHRNRATAYNRFVRSLVRDLNTSQDLPAGFTPECVCAAVANYVDHEYGPTIAAALKDWTGPSAVVPVSGNFSKPTAYTALVEHVITTPHNQSIVLLMDSDMVAFPGMTAQVLSYTRLGLRAFAPVIWSQAEVTEENKDPTQGQWRPGGVGMIAAFVSDLLDALGTTRFPLYGRVDWGYEDAALIHILKGASRLKSGFTVWRRCAPALWHIWHIHTKWRWTINGISRLRNVDIPAVNPWQEDGAEPWKLKLPPTSYMDAIIERKQMNRSICVRTERGAVY